MPWPIRVLDQRPSAEDRKIGDAWWAAPDEQPYPTPVGTKHRHLPRVLWVCLPSANGFGPYPFCVHAPATREGAEGAGWDVTGEAPNITVSPSILVSNTYHGYIRGGVITDDIEGRKY